MAITVSQTAAGLINSPASQDSKRQAAGAGGAHKNSPLQLGSDFSFFLSLVLFVPLVMAAILALGFLKSASE